MPNALHCCVSYLASQLVLHFYVLQRPMKARTHAQKGEREIKHAHTQTDMHTHWRRVNSVVNSDNAYAAAEAAVRGRGNGHAA